MFEDHTAAAVAQGHAFAELLRQRLVRNVVVPTPAAGAEWNQVVPAGVTWELLSAYYVLTTSAVVGNRSLTLQVRDPDGNRYVRIYNGGSVTPSTAAPVSWLAGLGAIAAGSLLGMALPGPAIPMPAGHQIGSLTSGMDVADAYTAIILSVREWSPNAALTASQWLEGHSR